MRIYVGVTDGEWFRFLASTKDVDEVNFWRPSPRTHLTTIQRNEMFLFKLKAPYNAIAGGGYYQGEVPLPISFAWGAFGVKNGAPTEQVLRSNILRLRTVAGLDRSDFTIGCVMLAQPFFFAEADWIPQPKSFQPGTQVGKYYDTEEGDGCWLWEQVNLRLAGRQLKQFELTIQPRDAPSYALVERRAGQGIFRASVAAAYNLRCAVTGERVVPVLEAAHIRPYREDGPNVVSNGLLLRADIHKLLDEDYVTVSPDYHFEVGKKLREDFENGRDYYALHGKQLILPARKVEWPDSEFIAWHNRRFRG
jgi:putative restriction endonuclease